MALVIKGSSSGQVTIDVPASAGTNSLTIPASTGTLALTSQLAGLIIKSSHDEITANATGSGTFSNIGLEAPITPASTSNKILLITTGSIGLNTTGAFRFTENNSAVGIGDPSGSKDRASFKCIAGNLNGSQNFIGSCILSPNSTSELTYRVQIESESGNSWFLNRSFNDSNSDSSEHAVTSSYLHVFELDGSKVTIST
jgi:hypothetical protein